MRRLGPLLVLAACGSAAPPAPPAHRALTDAPAAGSADVIVARVNGHPVWGSCVAAQATRTGGDRAAAVQDCIAFELLAWEAAARGYAADPDVASAVETAMVGAVISSYEDGPVPPELEAGYAKLARRNAAAHRHDDVRISTYVRVIVPEGAPAEVDARAHTVASAIAARTADERGLSTPDLLALAQPIAAAAGVTLEHDEDFLRVRADLDRPYGDALYGVPEVGRTTGPTRTHYGWDVILYAGLIPAEHVSDDEVRAHVLPDVKQAGFHVWVDAIAARLGIEKTFDPDYERVLDEAP